MRSCFYKMVPQPSGKAPVCKTVIRQFKSGRYLQNKKDIQSDVLFCLVEIKDGFEDLSAAQLSAAREGSTERNIYRFFLLGVETMQTNLAGTSKIPNANAFGILLFTYSLFTQNASVILRVISKSEQGRHKLCVQLSFMHGHSARCLLFFFARNSKG